MFERIQLQEHPCPNHDNILYARRLPAMHAMNTHTCATARVTGSRSTSVNAHLNRFFREPPNARNILQFAVRGTFSMSSAFPVPTGNATARRSPRNNGSKSARAHNSRITRAGQCFGHFASSHNAQNDKEISFRRKTRSIAPVRIARNTDLCFFRAMLLHLQWKNTAPATSNMLAWLAAHVFRGMGRWFFRGKR